MTDLALHVWQFVPDASGDDLEHRTALLKARDFSAALRGTAIGVIAGNNAADAHEMAGAFVFAPVPTARLEIAVKYCRHMVMAAYLADHLECEGTGQ